MPQDQSPAALLARLAEHPRADELSALVRTVALGAADERRTRLQDGLQELMAEAGLGCDDADTPLGNPLRALAKADGADGAARGLLGGLLARGIALAPPADAEGIGRLAQQLAWLSAHTPFDALWALDVALGSGAERYWHALAAWLARVDRGELGGELRPGALAAVAAIAASAAPSAGEERRRLHESLSDPGYRALLGLGPAAPTGEAGAATSEGPAASDGAAAGMGEGGGPAAAGESKLGGELVPAPLRLWALVLWAVTGVLLLRWLLRGLGRGVLRLRRPAELRVAPAGLTLSARLEVLGRTLRSSEIHVPHENLARAVREVRYPRLGIYVGLLSLALGSYLGVSWFVDGARAGSPSLLGLGIVVFGLGVLLDFVFAGLLPAGTGRTRLVFVPRKGAALALSTPDAAAATAALRRLASRT